MQEEDISKAKTVHSIESIKQMMAEVDQVLKEHDAKYGKPPPLSEEEQDRMNTEIRNYHRTRQAP